MLLATLLGACSDSGSSTQAPTGNEVGVADQGADQGAEQSSNSAAQQPDALPPIDPSAQAILEVSFTMKETGEGAPNVPFQIRWEEDGKPSSTDVRTAPDGTRRIQFDHGSRLIGLVIRPSALTAPARYKESALLMGGRTHKIHVELERGGVVGGIVLDIDGNPVPDAQVGVFFADAGTLDKIMDPSVDAFTHSDAQGRFRLGGLPSGPFVLEASAPNMVAVWRPGGVMKDAREFRDLEIMLEPSFVVYGQAIDADENPVADVFVTAGKPNRRVNRRETQYPEVFQHGPRTCLAKSDAEGLFSLDRVPESQSWNINGKHPLYLTTRTSFDAGQQDVWLEMTKGAVLSGNVVDQAGNPVIGAQIWLLSSSGEPTTFTDKHGNFMFGIGAERFGVSPLVFKQGSGIAFLPPMDILVDTPPLQVVLDNRLTIKGKVVDAEGHGLSGVPMRIAGTPPSVDYLAAQMPERFLDRDAVLTAPDGSFEFNELYDSVFTITARPSGHEAVVAEGVTANTATVVLTVK
jgi:protocatechuate 3,4-dioxygenase beta subunit